MATRVFVIGSSGCGKTVFGKALAEEFQKRAFTAVHSEASGNFKERNPGLKTREEYEEAGRKCWLSDDLYFMRHIQDAERYCNPMFNVVTGVRNPYDFTRLFRHASDVVVEISTYMRPDARMDRFGLEAIYGVIQFSKSCGYLSKDAHFIISAYWLIRTPLTPETQIQWVAEKILAYRGLGDAT